MVKGIMGVANFQQRPGRRSEVARLASVGLGVIRWAPSEAVASGVRALLPKNWQANVGLMLVTLVQAIIHSHALLPPSALLASMCPLLSWRDANFRLVPALRRALCSAALDVPSLINTEPLQGPVVYRLQNMYTLLFIQDPVVLILDVIGKIE